MEGHFLDDLGDDPAPGKQQGQRIRGFYRQRWGIESQGFRYLSQTWNIDRPAGHSYGAVLARLVFVLMIYNSGQLFKQASCQRLDYAVQLRRMRRYGPGVRLAGATNIAITEPACGRQVRILRGLYHSGTAAACPGAHSANLAARPEVGSSLEDTLKTLDSIVSLNIYHSSHLMPFRKSTRVQLKVAYSMGCLGARLGGARVPPLCMPLSVAPRAHCINCPLLTYSIEKRGHGICLGISGTLQ